ncbi:hypothetical protein NM688_g5575 [Phlebia brevispora]|uniref:Uncharacterized protein n=1 Tax=Phlebia brevispora TaxID=194682 RepID=A0ACC1STE7_9APHY|nr:hypothetical protein NM688_g5575 [Phlebia brevispora]
MVGVSSSTRVTYHWEPGRATVQTSSTAHFFPEESVDSDSTREPSIPVSESVYSDADGSLATRSLSEVEGVLLRRSDDGDVAEDASDTDASGKLRLTIAEPNRLLLERTDPAADAFMRILQHTMGPSQDGRVRREAVARAIAFLQASIQLGDQVSDFTSPRLLTNLAGSIPNSIMTQWLSDVETQMLK